jgi:hypothetical protein
MAGLWKNLVGTTSNFLKIGLAGVRLKNSSGNLVVRNTADAADAAVTASKVNVSGDSIDINSDAAGAAADWKYTLQRPAAGMSAAVALTLPPTDGSPNQVLKTDGNGVLDWTTVTTSSTITYDTTTLSFGDSATVAMFTMPANAVVTQIDVIIDTPFNGTAPQMSVGVSGTVSKYAGATEIDLKGTAKDVYSIFPGEAPVGTTEDLIITYTADSSSAGSARVIVAYAVPA